MKLVSYIASGETAPMVGAVVPEGVLPLHTAAARAGLDTAPFTNMLALLRAGPPGMALAQQCIAQATSLAIPYLEEGSYQLLAPVPRPTSLRDCMAFETHLLQATRGAADILYPPAGRIDRILARIFGRGFLGVPKLFHAIPAYYKGNPGSVVGPNAQVIWPDYEDRLDYELEFGVFIGIEGKDIPPENAMRHVAGFTIFNDFSARTTQLNEMKLRLGPAKGKDFDTGNAMGPWLVTPDEIPDPYQLTMTARVNGEVWTQARSDGMAFSFEQIISYISRSETLYPGDFIAAGTVGGGCGLEHGRWLYPGDHIELEVEGLGVLANVITRGTHAQG